MGGIVGAIAGPVLGGIFGGSSQTSAGNQMATGQMQGAQVANQQLAAAGNNAQQNVQPYMQAGQQALGQYQNLLNGGAANFDLSKMPGYNFQMQQGQQALDNSAAARGGALSGNALQATQQFGQGLASTQFQNYMSQLQGMAGMGLNASQNLNQNQVNLAQAGAGYMNSGITGAANAQAGATIGSNNAYMGAVNGVLGNSGVQQGLGSIFGGGGNQWSSLGSGNNGTF